MKLITIRPASGVKTGGLETIFYPLIHLAVSSWNSVTQSETISLLTVFTNNSQLNLQNLPLKKQIINGDRIKIINQSRLPGASKVTSHYIPHDWTWQQKVWKMHDYFLLVVFIIDTNE